MSRPPALLALLVLCLALPACDRPDPVALAQDAEAKLEALYPRSDAAQPAIDADVFSQQLAAMIAPLESVDFDAWEARGGGPLGPANDVDTLRNGPLPRPEAEPAIALLDEMITDEWLRPLADLRAAPRFVREWKVNSTGESIDPLSGRVRATMRVLLAHSRIHHHRQDWDAAAKSIEYALALGHVMQHDPVALHRLVGLSVQNATLEEIRLQLTESGHDEASCAHLLRVIDELCSTPPLRPTLEVEALLIPPSLASQGYSNRDIQASLDAVTADFDRLVALQSEPYIEQDQDADFLGMLLSSGMGERLKRRELISLQRSMLAAIVRQEARWRNDRDATTLLLHIHLYRHRRGDFPASLDQLVPDQLAAIPPDFITGAPFVYRVEDGKPILYSVGLNGADDGGKAMPPGMLADPVEGPDIVFTRDRRPVPDLDLGWGD